ncbi:MAG: hypothetical protein Q8S58_19545 [Bosea sp. (in: a-proteobacteria)]|uniref:hypothetical protein n=1 Tax=Bosea sp. (in: a-proteobacteria) TaxID=1871050 RepID=UPI002736332F|nr:hypothetical protein [Bosea sp. (in: a-proteobacteria)]MDP3258444.1 hypothetical protein [Bosea sp. (in: a-proteobacteria)]MDP3321323.1 hypothetical protein [Bosea sp. (in: a-proteobacteria)]
MDFGNAPRTAPIGGLPVVPRNEVVATQGSVSVDLPPERTVQSAQAGEAVKLDLRAQERNAQDRASQARDFQARDVQSRAAFDRRSAEGQKQERQAERDLDAAVERRIVIEPRTRAIVIQQRDSDTGETISQLPDETMLKLRIYSRELADRAREADDAPPPKVERIA